MLNVLTHDLDTVNVSLFDTNGLSLFNPLFTTKHMPEVLHVDFYVCLIPLRLSVSFRFVVD